MQVGDLVELSAYGNSLEHNEYVVGKLGLVKEAESRFNTVKIEWIGTRISPRRYHRRELKYAKCLRSSAG